MSSELTEYTKNFLTDTLGIHSILTDAAKNTSTVILVENLNSYNSEESELLEKMISALKLDSRNCQILDLSSGSNSAQIILKDDPQSSNETYSPRVLLQKPELKRKAWEDLKRAFSRP